MPIIALSIVIQIACAVHCVRGGRNQLWLMVIIFLSIPGCLAYAIFEILPDYAGRRSVRAVRQAAAKAIDPERDLRLARDALEVADTAANRTDLADALGALGRWAEAIPHYEQAEAKAPGVDRGLRLKLAKACFEAGWSDRALSLIEALPPSGSASENDRAALLHARLLEEAGNAARALAIYADVGERMPGAEAQCRQAALLIARGRRAEALPLLVEAEKRAKRMDRYERAKQAGMYDWAAEQLAELRQSGA
ncbi:MAG TPA: tetratricopeptide repeat protein [Allosphingosinicella sp.]|nr:tetratricopeptide repeat protein [Allosphingosinicella sp.]